MKNNNSMIMIISVALVMGVVGFMAGVLYQKQQLVGFARGQMMGKEANKLTNDQKNGGRMMVRDGSGQGFGGPTSGEIVSIDDQSMTIKTVDGSSKIVIISDSTEYQKTSAGSKTDLKVGEQVRVIGQENADGSLTAKGLVIGENLSIGMMNVQAPTNK